MVRNLLIRGMLTGVLAGVLAWVFAWVFGEPEVRNAIAFEEHESSAHGDHPEEEIVSRGVQSTIGMLTGVGVYGIAIGGLFALVFAFAYGRIGPFKPRATAGLLALLGFVVVIVVPFLKYPANPPAVGDPDTIGRRTTLYFGMVALSVLFTAAAVLLARHLAPRLGAWNAIPIAVAAFVAAVGLAMWAMPTVNEIPAEFSAPVVWRFRMASLGMHAIIWTTFGLLFGLLAERVLFPTTEVNQPTQIPAPPTPAGV
ncbi:CbtA family protein [Embleya sp. NBC_00896]|uniref:CbtA family protein n=1 Tax=Embleya sp. NBC_00896 TaxID=2975961 RepID=UPI003868E821|nr:CbtA family protein [Embleya sp. NBC_00896]